MKRLLLASTVLFPIAAQAQMGLPLSNVGSFVPVVAPSGCTRVGWVDGCSNAPSGTPQYPALLSSYAIRPGWNVAGVDYYAGIPAGTTLTDPSTISLSGVTVNASAHTISVSGSNIILSGYNFGLANGWKVTISGANDTIENSQFTGGSNQSTSGFDGVVLALQGSGTTTIVDNNINGNNIAVTAQAGSLITVAGSGTVIMEHNYISNAAGDMIDVGATSLAEWDFRYNLVENACSLATAHGDVIQYYQSDISSGPVDFNTVYQHGAAGCNGEGILATYNEGSGQTISNMTERNNTLISLGVGDDWGPGTFVENDVGTAHANYIVVYDNFLDPTKISYTLWYGTGSLGQYETILPTPSAWYSLTNLVTGALIPLPTKSNPGTDGFYVYPDNNGVSPSLAAIYTFTPSPATGDVTTGNTILITVLMNAPTAVTGTPTITLNSGGVATYQSGSGTTSLVFSYTVGAGDAASPLAVTAITGTMKDDVGNATLLTPLTNLTTSFAGLQVNAGSALAFTSLTPASIRTTTAGSGTYSGTAPTGLTNPSYGGGCSGVPTITAFSASASGGVWNATFTTPTVACTGTLTVTGLTNTATVTSPSTTFTSGITSTGITCTAISGSLTAPVASGTVITSCTVAPPTWTGSITLSNPALVVSTTGANTFNLNVGATPLSGGSYSELVTSNP